MDTRLGTAGWIEHAEVSARFPYTEGHFWLGRASDQTPIGYSDDRHICLVSGTRGGKGTSTIVNNLCLWPGSVIVVDPKGENATITAARRGGGGFHCEGMGQDVHVLDPFEVADVDASYRSCFNPLDALDPDDEKVIDESVRLADALVLMRPDAKDPFWDESARLMVHGLILHVLTAPGFEGKRDLVSVRRLIAGGDRETAEILRASGDESIPPAHGLLWSAMSLSHALGGIVAEIGNTFLELYRNARQTYEGALQQAKRQTEFLDSPPLQRMMRSSDFSLSDLKTKPGGVSLFLCLPQSYMSTHFRWLRMIIALTLTEMEKTKGQPVTGHRVLFCLDEFAGLKRMEVIENGVAQMAGFGVKFLFVLQSLEQLKGTYQEKWETFLGNSGLKIFFNLDEHFSRDYVSKLIGDMEIIRETHSQTEGSSESESQSDSKGRSSSETKGRSTSRGHSTSEGTSHSQGRSESESASQSRTKSSGLSSGTSWDPQSFLAPTVYRSASKGTHASNSFTDGTSQSWSESETQGRNWGRSESETDGTSESHGSGTSETTGRSKGTSRSHSAGASETLHRRRLLPPEEIGRMFTRISNAKHSMYPGLALVLISGEQAMAVRRVHYFEDLYFIGLFRPHPDHKFNAPKEYRFESAQLADLGLSWTLVVSDRELVKSGDVIGLAWREEGKPTLPNNGRPPIKAPVRGRLRHAVRFPSAARPSAVSLLLPQSGDSQGVAKALEQTKHVMSALMRGGPTANVPTILTYDAVTGLPDPFAELINAARIADMTAKAELEKLQAERLKATLIRMMSRKPWLGDSHFNPMASIAAQQAGEAVLAAEWREIVRKGEEIRLRQNKGLRLVVGAGLLMALLIGLGTMIGPIAASIGGVAGVAALIYAVVKYRAVAREAALHMQEAAKKPLPKGMFAGLPLYPLAVPPPKSSKKE